MLNPAKKPIIKKPPLFNLRHFDNIKAFILKYANLYAFFSQLDFKNFKARVLHYSIILFFSVATYFLIQFTFAVEQQQIAENLQHLSQAVQNANQDFSARLVDDKASPFCDCVITHLAVQFLTSKDTPAFTESSGLSNYIQDTCGGNTKGQSFQNSVMECKAYLK